MKSAFRDISGFSDSAAVFAHRASQWRATHRAVVLSLRPRSCQCVLVMVTETGEAHTRYGWAHGLKPCMKMVLPLSLTPHGTRQATLPSPTWQLTSDEIICPPAQGSIHLEPLEQVAHQAERLAA